MKYKTVELWDLVTDFYPAAAFRTFEYVNKIPSYKDPLLNFMKKGTGNEI